MRILIIEDDAETRDFLKMSLETESFAVDTAYDGDKGSYMARTNDYDLIILDHTLPLKSGAVVCKDIRKTGKLTPIIMLSVVDNVETKIDLLTLGADDYVSKPFSFEELLARIRALLRRPQLIQNSILQVSDLVLDINKQSVKRGTKGVYLTKKQFSLLEYLMKNKGKVLSRGMIMEHVWNIESDPFSNTIEAHILNLRKRIRGGNKRELIHNVPGRGYKIDEEK